MKRSGVVQRTCAILAELIGGREHDRQSIAAMHGVELAAADRYIKHLLSIPGVGSMRRKRRLFIHWAGVGYPLNGLPLSDQSIDLLHRLASFGVYGITPEQVAARFIDEGVQRFCQPLVLKAAKL